MIGFKVYWKIFIKILLLMNILSSLIIMNFKNETTGTNKTRLSCLVRVVTVNRIGDKSRRKIRNCFVQSRNGVRDYWNQSWLVASPVHKFTPSTNKSRQDKTVLYRLDLLMVRTVGTRHNGQVHMPCRFVVFVSPCNVVWAKVDLGNWAWTVTTNQGPAGGRTDACASSKFRPQFYFYWISNFLDFSALPQLQSLLASTFCSNWLIHLVVIDAILWFM